jgi:hypothetical protein
MRQGQLQSIVRGDVLLQNPVITHVCELAV